MQAIQITPPGGLANLHLVTIPDPALPGPGEILVRIRASSLNYHDYAVCAGIMPTAANRIPLSDASAELISAGPGVTLAPGAHLISLFFPTWQSGPATRGDFTDVPGDGVDGFACALFRAPATAFTPAPAGYSHREAATLSCAALTAWRALMVEGRLREGETVLIQGTGGVSLFALQIAKACGAKIIATSSSDAKLERLRALGADHLINYRTTPEWGAAALNLTNGRGVDHVVEIGGAGTLPQSLIAVRPGGHISLIGILAGWNGAIPTVMITTKQIRLIGITVGSAAQQQDMVAFLETHAIKPVIDKAFPLENLADAFRYQETNQHFGKIVIDV